MAFWQDQTIRVDGEPIVERAPDDTVHLTWQEPGETGISFTLIMSRTEADKMAVRIRAEIAEAART